jgi:hypothetical protein
VIEKLVDPVVWLSGLVWIKQMPLELFSLIDPRKNRLTKELDISSHLRKEVIAPLVQNLVNDVQFDTKPVKSLSRYTKPCFICANSYTVAPLPPHVPATVEIEDGPFRNIYRNHPALI